jgi:pyridinium-3,5-biscarboxylic acid mononucleotide sulfurtransferase
MPPERKLIKLKNVLRRYDSCLVAFSGGVDSSFLLAAARRYLPASKLLAVTATSETYPPAELRFARRLCNNLKVRHKVIKTGELEDKRFTGNTAKRCYFCKDELFSQLKNIARKYAIKTVVDATTLSDKKDFRPGNRAKIKWQIRSPLVEAGLTKEEVRRISKKWRLPSWDKPAQACLASRIPYGTKITPLVLKRVLSAESFLHRLGFQEVRVRDYGALCRIEVNKNKIAGLLGKKERLIRGFKGLGYSYITVDLEGYRTGSLNEVLKNTCVKRS